MKKLIFVMLLGGVAYWLNLNTQVPNEISGAKGPQSAEPEAASASTSTPALSGPENEDKLVRATQNLLASDFSKNFAKATPLKELQTFKTFEDFFKSRENGQAALDFLEHRAQNLNEAEPIPDAIFSALSDALSQLGIDLDIETRIKILNVLAHAPERAPAVKTLALRELFMKMPSDDGGDTRNRNQRTVAAYETYLATKPTDEEILSVTVDTFYFTESSELNDELKTVLEAQAPQLAEKVESRFKNPFGSSNKNADSPNAPRNGEE